MNEAQYYKNIKNSKIAIFGITPPPLGGVSVHIQRIAQKFKENGNQVYHFKTEFRGRRFSLAPYLLYAFFYLWLNKINILYYHSSYLPNYVNELHFLSFIKKILNFKLILVEHNCRHMYKRNKSEKLKLNKATKNIDQIVFLWDSTYHSYIDNKMKLPQKYIIDSAFLPPDQKQKQDIIKTYPESLHKFINNHKPILLVNASIISLLENQDLYGLDKSINIIAQLKKNTPNIGLIIALANIGNHRYFEKLNKIIKDLSIKDNVYFLLDQRELWPLMENIDIFLRPTLRDGTAISIFEAFLYNKTVVASNVCKRPKGTITFDINNEDDFYKKIEYLIKKGKNYEHNKQHNRRNQKQT